jgi:hypothetical protein
MSAQDLSKYTFLPWVKMGLGASISNNEKDLIGPRAKVKLDLSVRMFDRSNNLRKDPDPISKDFLLYGPGDIAGILNSIIIRTQPRANDLNFESNYFPFIEFSQPDFPWRYTPAMPSRDQQSGGFSSRLSPWISLIVLKEQEFERRPSTEPGLLPHIFVRDPVNSLPDLDQCWSCAHTQITQEITSSESLREILASEPHKVISRILSLRKLESNSHYFAFVVPTFEVGRLAGLGLSIDSSIKGTTFAWTVGGSPPEISPMQNVFPVYYQWEFSTSPQTGDFESLVEKLEPRSLSNKVGLQKLDVSEPFLSVDKDIGFKKPLFFGGVLWSPLAAKDFAKRRKIEVRGYFIGPDPESPGEALDPDNPSNQEIKEFIMEMKEIIDLGERLSWSFVKKSLVSNEVKDPIISPPMYGKWHARKRLVSKISNDNKDPLWIQSLELDPHPDWDKIRNDHPYQWLEELNLDPTNRAAAGLGAAVIQELQEELMSSAWDQAGSLREANKRLRLSQLARTISSNLFERCLIPLENDVLITITRPLHTKVIVEKNNNKSVARLLRESPIPKAIFTASFTKITAKRSKVHRRLFDRNGHISFGLLAGLNQVGNTDVHTATILSGEASLLTIDHLVGPVSEDNFQGNELKNFLEDQLIPNHIREMVKSIEKSIPTAKSTVVEAQGEQAPLGNIHAKLNDSLNPTSTIELKVSMEVKRPERLQEEKKDKLDPIVAYPEFKRPMFEPLRDLSEDLLLPGIKDIPLNTITLVVTNPSFINSYMVGLNHEMARELLWREYPTDQRGSYFRQFWDVSAAIERERIRFPTEDDEKIIEKYRDIPEIHKWKDWPLKEIKWNDSSHEETTTVTQGERPVLLIKGELLMRYPGAVIYASKAELKNSKPALPDNEDIKLPVLRGTIAPDIVLLGFDISIDELCGDFENDDPGYFIIIQEQPSEPRFAIDVVEEDTNPDLDSLKTWNDLNWNYITLLPGSNNNIDLENGQLKGKQIDGVTWGSHAADIANILLQQPVRIAVHARELVKNLDTKKDDEEEDKP